MSRANDLEWLNRYIKRLFLLHNVESFVINCAVRIGSIYVLDFDSLLIGTGSKNALNLDVLGKKRVSYARDSDFLT